MVLASSTFTLPHRSTPQVNLEAQEAQTRRSMVLSANIFPAVQMITWTLKVIEVPQTAWSDAHCHTYCFCHCLDFPTLVVPHPITYPPQNYCLMQMKPLTCH